MRTSRLLLSLALLILAGGVWNAIAQENAPDNPPAGTAANETPEPPADPAALLKKSDTLWETRHDSGKTLRSVIAAEKALEAGADEFEVRWRIARGCFWLAERSSSAKEKVTYGERGWREGQKAADLRPERVEGWYWGVISLGQYSEGIGIAKAFFQGVAPKFEKMNNKAMELDKSYGYAGPPRALGRYWHQVPWPKKNLGQAETLMKESIRLYPGKCRSHFYLAEIYLEQGKRELARESLDTCIALDPRREEFPDGVIFRAECQRLMKETFGAAN